MGFDFDGFDEAQMRSKASMKWSTSPVANTPAKTLESASGHWIAEMDYGTAPAVKRAVEQAVGQEFFGYLPPHLARRTALAVEFFERERFGFSVDPTCVSLASSVLDGFCAMLQGLLEPGSTVIVPTPAYMPFLTLPQLHGHRVHQVPGQIVRGRWQLDFEALEAAAHSGDLLVLCNPWNPTGRVLEREELERVGEIAQRHDLLVFADEVHAGLVPQPRRHVPYLSVDPSFADHAVMAVAASKAFNVAGLHCAQMIVGRGKLAGRWEQARRYLHPAAPLGAIAAIAAYREGGEWLDAVNAYVDENLTVVDEFLAGRALSWTRPEGTYMGFIDASALGSECPAEDFVRAGILVNDGKACGSGFDQFIRFNVATGRSVLRRSLERFPHPHA